MTTPIHELVPDYIREITPYVQGRPIEEVERELQIEPVKLASNENPLGPSPLAVEAARNALSESNRYPDGSGFYLRQALARKHEISMDQIILGGGSTELIDLVARLLLRPHGCGRYVLWLVPPLLHRGSRYGRAADRDSAEQLSV